MSRFVERMRRWAQSKPSKLACIIDESAYTYYDLFEAIQREIKLHPQEAHTIVLIQEGHVWLQLIKWLAALAQGAYPITCHKELIDGRLEAMKAKYLGGDLLIPKKADFGVLSSGTTGIPKVLWRREDSWIDYFPLQNKVFHLNAESILFMQGSFSFTGNTNMMLALLWEGGTLVTSDTMSVRRWVKLLQTYSPSHLYMLPTKLRLLLRHSKEIIEGLSYMIAGSQMPDSLMINQLQSRFPGMKFILYYGASELNYISWCTYEDWLEEPNTVGYPFEGVKVTSKNQLLYVDTPYGVEGISRPYTVGDKGYISSSGRIILEGRKDSMINKGGYKLFIPDIEGVLQNLSTIDQVTLLNISDDLRGEDYIACVILHNGFSEKQCEEEIKEALLTVERPKSIYFVEEIPLTDCGKVDKLTLEKWYNNRVK